MDPNQKTETENEYIKLDYSLQDKADRIALVDKIIKETPREKLTNKYLEILGTYILNPSTVKERKSPTQIITKNRQVTISKREVSLEGFAYNYNNGLDSESNIQPEDLIHNLMVSDKTMFLLPRYDKISQQDIETIPGLKEIVDEIHRLEEIFKTAKGKQKYVIKQMIIGLSQDQYILRGSVKPTINCSNAIKAATKLDLYENITVNSDGSLTIDANITLLDPLHVSALLCNYESLKSATYGKFDSDMYYMLLDLDNLIEKTFLKYPIHKRILELKIDGYKNEEIQQQIKDEFDTTYSIEYISSLWRNKIPKLIAEQAQKDWLEWHYTEEEKGYWKRCSRCGQIKLGHNKFFSKNKTSKDGWYSICKDCRNKKS